MEIVLKRWFSLNIWLKVIALLCLIGGITNGMLLVNDIAQDGVLFRLHLGFFILYIAQIVFILLNERLVFVLAVLQGIMALMTSADFTFVPVVRVIGRLIYQLTTPTIESEKVYKYVLISASFSLQMLSAYAEFSLLPKPKKPAVSPSEDKETIPSEIK